MATVNPDPIDRTNNALDALIGTERGHDTNHSTRDPLDPTLAETVRRLRALDAAGAPDTYLTNRIWEDLMSQTASAASLPQPRSRLALPIPNGRVAPPSQWMPVRRATETRRGWAIPQILLAALLLLSLGGGYLAFRPSDSDPDRPLSIPAAIAPVATPGTPAATPTVTPFPLTDHLIIGLWQFDIETRQPGIDLAYYSFAEDGTFVGVGERGDYVHFGNWRAIGEGTVELVSVLQEIPEQRVFDPGYVPVGNVLGPGVLSVRLTLEIDTTGNTVIADGEGTFYNEDGTVANTFDGPNAHSIGTRMEVVPTEPTPIPTP